jgi:hypothetical protein
MQARTDQWAQVLREREVTDKQVIRLRPADLIDDVFTVCKLPDGIAVGTTFAGQRWLTMQRSMMRSPGRRLN